MTFKRIASTIFISSLSIALAGCGSDDILNDDYYYYNSRELNIFSARNYGADHHLHEVFERETGIRVNVIHGTGEELLERLYMEGSNTQADLFITIDGAVLNLAKDRDLLQPIVSPSINYVVPYNLRDVDNYWVGFAKRARIFAYAKDRVDPMSIQNYEDVANIVFEDRVVSRSSSHLYTQSLVASFIAIYGEEAATKWAAGVANNMARPPSGGDRDQVISVASGVGDVAITYSYYIGQMLNSTNPEEVRALDNIGLVFPNQDTTGTHVNVSGVAITKYSSNTQEALEFIYFMLSPYAQNHIVAYNFEFPVNPSIRPPEFLAEHHGFKAQDIHISELGVYNAQAIQILNRVGWR
jgi:iron(III) transport system substrate-binding protein